jgi:hypothetical protein
LLLNKYLYPIILFLTAFIISCKTDDDSSRPKMQVNFEDPAAVLAESQRILGDKVAFAYKGYFTPDSSIQVAAGEEIENNDLWGIRFSLLKMKKGTLEKVYQSEILEGSFRDAMIKKIKFPDFTNELLYYNSRDYFLGSGGGEVFSYIINFEEQQVYYAHLFSGAATGIQLYISENVGDNLKNFFVSNFRRDFPDLKIASQDVDLQ